MPSRSAMTYEGRGPAPPAATWLSHPPPPLAPPPLDDAVDHVARHVRNAFVELRYLARLEALADQSAQRGVPRRVHRQHQHPPLVGDVVGTGHVEVHPGGLR